MLSSVISEEWAFISRAIDSNGIMKGQDGQKLL